MPEAESGYDEFLACLKALPSKYNSIRDRHAEQATEDANAGMDNFGPRTEQVVRDIFEEEGLKPVRPKPLYKRYVRPDILIEPHDYVEVTKWGDTNKLGSILAQGFLVKSAVPQSRYFAVVAGLDAADTWTERENVDFYLMTKIGGKVVVDLYFGFRDIDRLVEILTASGTRA